MQHLLRQHWPVIAYLALLSLLRLYLMGHYELTDDEAYYWEWSRNLAPSYYDQGPGVAFAIAAGTALFGHTELGVRFPAWVLGILVSILAYRIAATIYGSNRAGFFAVLVLSLMPIGFLGGILMMHDTVQFAAWAFFCYGIYRFLIKEHWLWLYWSAAALVMGTLAKHTMVLALPALTLFLLAHPPLRKVLRNPHFWLAGLLSGTLLSPIIYWNLQHDWTGVSAIVHLPSARAKGNPFYLRMLDFLFFQILLVGPLVFVSAIAGIRHPKPLLMPAKQLLIIASLFIFCFFWFMTLRKTIQPNWVICAWFGGTILAGAWLADQWQTQRRLVPILTLLSSLFLISVALTPAPYLWVADTLGAKLGPEAIQTNRLTGGREMAAYVQKIRDRHPGAHVAGNRYQEAALMAFYLPEQPRTYSLNLGSRPNQYDFWERPEGDFVYLQIGQGTLPKAVTEAFESVEPFPPQIIERYDRPARYYQVFLLRGMKRQNAPSPGGISTAP
ncbi:MAG: glycosyltransferase family 39 protein [Candidatus Hydrogenedentes bacterium]|nr:glycosyltransferase family 39 protein [Candidatus Hydrogenedentota bacterium]